MSAQVVKAPPVVVWKNVGWLRGLAISAVVFNHATQYNVFMGIDAHRQWSAAELFILFIGRGLSPICIPIFLLASGYSMGRFSDKWSTALPAAKTFALRYLAWSVVMYAGHFAINHDFDLGRFLIGVFLTGEAQHAYWFALTIIHFYLLTPWLSALVSKYTKAAIVLGVVLLAIAIARGYLDAAGIHLLPAMYLTPLVAPFFLIGLLFAKKCDQTVALLLPYRRAFGIVALLFAPLSILEIVGIGYLWGDGTVFTWGWNAGDRLALHIFSLAGTFWMILAPSQNTKFRRALDWIGLRSLAILLLFDMFLRAAFVLCWHGERWLGLTTRPASIAPEWMSSAWLSLPLTVLGIAAPLAVVVLTERFFGKRFRTLVFG